MTTIAGRYEILSEIGRGGMGVVYLAEDSMIGRKVALKKLSLDPDDPESEQAVKRFVREARLTGQLNHPGIVTLFDLIDEEGDLYLALEYYPSRSLADVVEEDGPLPEERTRSIGAQVAGALATAHAEGVIHRDIKPENILVGEKGAKLTDFGIARITEGSQEQASRITKTGFFVGTVGYLAPEQISHDADVTPVSDVFALGCVLYFCLTGEDPFGEGTVANILYKVVSQEIELDQLPVSAGMREILRAATAKDPAARPDAELLGAVLAGEKSLPASQPPAAVAPGPAPGPAPHAYAGYTPYGAHGAPAAAPGGPPAPATTPPGAGYAPPAQQPVQHGWPVTQPPPAGHPATPAAMPAAMPAAAPAKRPRRKLTRALVVILLGLATIAAVMVAGRQAGRIEPDAPPAARVPATPYSSAQGFKSVVPGTWQADYEPVKQVDRFWPTGIQGGIMVHRMPDDTGDIMAMTDGAIAGLVRIDPVGRENLAVDNRSISIDKTAAYAGNPAVVASYELESSDGTARYTGRTYFFGAGGAIWSVYEIAPRGQIDKLQPQFSEFQSNFAA